MNQLVSFFKRNRLKFACLLCGVLILLVTFHIFSHRGTDRRVFLFPVSGSTKNQKEIRYLTKNPVQGVVAYYIDELILGPACYRGRPLFSMGTKLDYCFVRDSILYVGLSEEAVLQDGNALELNAAIALFKKNIKKNFRRIKEIELFISENYITD